MLLTEGGKITGNDGNSMSKTGSFRRIEMEKSISFICMHVYT